MNDSYTAALQEAKEELRGIESALAKLLPRKVVVESLIQTLSQAIGSTAYPKSLPPVAPQTDMFTQTEDFLWKQVARAMKGSTGFTMAQAGQAVEQMTGKSLEPNRPQKIRNSMIRHTETFAQNADGTWRVIREID